MVEGGVGGDDSYILKSGYDKSGAGGIIKEIRTLRDMIR
jgi:hypothetical protein